MSPRRSFLLCSTSMRSASVRPAFAGSGRHQHSKPQRRSLPAMAVGADRSPCGIESRTTRAVPLAPRGHLQDKPIHDVFDEFKHQLPDIDPAETQEWVDSLNALVDAGGPERARFVLYKLLKRARQLHVGLPPLTQTRYIHTISPEQQPFFPGDESMELRIP